MMFIGKQNRIQGSLLGNKKKPNSERVLINEPGDHPTTWNQYRGRLWLARTAIGGKLIFQSFMEYRKG